MIGVCGYSVYIPRYRLSRELIAAAWGTKAPPGCKAVRNYDEDSLTMACAAVRGFPAMDALYFASTSAPYWQRSSASLIAAASNLSPAIATADFGGSLRAGTSALRSAFDAVAAGSSELVVVAAADAREPEPESPEELAFGDAAAAMAIGKDGVIADLIGFGSRSDDFPDEWRRDVDAHVRAFGSKFSLTRGYQANVVEAGRELLEKAGVRPAEIARAALASPDGRAHVAAAKALEIPVDRLEQPETGVTGAAMPLLLLAQALERARPGELILAIGYGDGADAFLLRAEQASPGSRRDRRALEYPSYAIYRKLRECRLAAPSGPEISNVLWEQEEPQNLRLRGTACAKCGAVQYPMTRVCGNCRATEGLTQKPLARRGRVFTFTKDYLYEAPVQPTIMTVVDLEDGARFLCQMTDADEREVEIGMEVELVLRRLRESATEHHYYWKCRPV